MDDGTTRVLPIQRLFEDCDGAFPSYHDWRSYLPQAWWTDQPRGRLAREGRETHLT